MKRRVHFRKRQRELQLVRRSAEKRMEDGLGASHRLQICIGCDGSAHYSTRI